MSGSINLIGPSTNVGAPAITPAAINSAVNAALTINGNSASAANTAEQTRALAAEANLATAITNEQTRATAAEGAIIPGVPASTVLPVIDSGVGVIGTLLTYARADHGHPTDTSRYAANNPSGFQTAANVTTSLTAAAWVPSTAYAVGTLLTYGGSLYQVNAAFTSGTTFATTNLNTLVTGGGGGGATAGVGSFNARSGVVTLTAADVTGVLGAGLPVAQGGTGATTNTSALVSLGAAAMSPYDLRRFGWIGDGSDESAKIQAAHDAMPAAGGRMVIPGSNLGTGIGTTINITKPCEIVGQGNGPNGSVLLVPTTQTVTMFNVTAQFCTFDNLSFGPRYPGTTKQTAGSYIMVASTAGRFRASRLMMIDFFEGITVTGNVATFELVDIRGLLYATGKGQTSAFLHLQGGMDVRVSNMILQGPSAAQVDCKAGVWIEALGDAVFSQCNIVGMGTTMLVAPGQGQVVTSLWISNTFLDSAYRGLDLAPTGTGVILRGRMSSSWASSHIQEGIRVGAGVNGFDVSDSHIFLNTSNGVSLNGGSNVRVLGSQIAQNANNGVYVAPGVSDWTVDGCEIGALSGMAGNTNNPVYVDTGASDRYSVTGNRFRGNGTDTVTDNGAGLHKNVSGNIGDIYGYRNYRDAASGHLRLIGTQATYSGFDWFGSDGALALAQLDPTGFKVLGSPVLTTVTGQPLGSHNQSLRVATATGNVVVTASDAIVVVKKTTAAATTVALEASPATGRVVTIKDGRGDAATNTITISPAAGTIDGATTMTLAVNYGSVTVAYNGTEWGGV